MPGTDDPDEVAQLRDELAHLREENEELRSAVDGTAGGGAAGPPTAPPHRVRRGARWVCCLALVVVGSLLVPASVLAVWLNRTVSDTDRWVATMAPLARDPAIQDAVANRVEQAIFDNVDVESSVRGVLPPEAGVLAAPISAGIETLVSDVVGRVVRSDRFATLWDEANRVASEQALAVLTNASGQKGVIEIDLTSVAQQAVGRLDELGVPFVDQLAGQQVRFELYRSDGIGRLQDAFGLFDRTATALPWVTLAVFGAAVLVAPVRRRGLLFSAIGWVSTTSLLVVGIGAARALYLGALPAGASVAANEAVFDILSRFLRGAVRTTLAVGLVVLVLTLLFGPSGPAVRLRSWWSRLVAAAGDQADSHGVDLGPVGAWVARNVVALRIAVAVVAVLWLLTLERPSAGNVLWLAGGALVALGVVELVARVGAAGGADPPAEELPPGDGVVAP